MTEESSVRPGPDQASVDRTSPHSEVSRQLARHALGLPAKHFVSYRNYFAAEPGHDDFPEWIGMCARGLARRRGDLFFLTRKGAEGALNPGESLRPQDFPPAVNAARPEQTVENSLGRNQ